MAGNCLVLAHSRSGGGVAAAADAKQNAVADRLLAFSPEDMPDDCADMLLANILAGPLIDLASRLSALVRPGGRIALSGILCDQLAQVEEAYDPWFELDAPRTKDEWAILSGCRKQRP